MKDTIIDTAGQVWHELGFSGKATSRDLARAMNADEQTVNMALGWLAREDKVLAEGRRGKPVFSLADSERQVFQGFYGEPSAKKARTFWNKIFQSEK
ncbi:MAG: winged helix-turn-helix domain-containing protein [Candidatus Omnitrophota bacterium]